MTRVLAGLALVALVPADPPEKLTPQERQKLEAKWDELNTAGVKQQAAGKYSEAQKAFTEALAVARRLYPTDEFPDGHGDLATSLNNFASLLQDQGKLADAELHYRAALEMLRRLFKGDHADLATALNNLAGLLQDRGKLAEAEPLYRDALAMRKRLAGGDDADLAESTNNLAVLLQDQGKFAEAEALFADALAMRKRLFKGDHVAVADGLNNLAGLRRSQGKLAEAEPLYRAALEMYRRLYKGDHSDVALGLNNLAVALREQGKLTEAEPLFKDALEMRKRLFPGDHPAVATSLSNLAGLRRGQGKLAEAEPLYRDALEMYRRLSPGDHPDLALVLNNLGLVLQLRGRFADAEPIYRASLATYRSLVREFTIRKTEGEALTLLASLPFTRDNFLSNARQAKSPAAAVYPEVWASKAAVARVTEQRQQAARAAGTNPAAAVLLAGLADARRRRAELILAPEVKDPATRTQRADDIRGLDKKIATLDQAVRPLLPMIGRAEKLAAAAPSELQKVLPADAAVVDFLRYVFFEQDKDRPGVEGEKRTESYLAFVLTRDKVAWIDLGPAAPIEAAVNLWREAITAGKEIPPAVASRVRELVWEKVRAELALGVKLVYVSPDLALSRVPWAALPGDRPGTILLEDFAVAAVPHGSFLLDQLWPRDDRTNTPAGVLVVGGVSYDAGPHSGGEPANRDLPVKPGAKGWASLPGAAAEATGVAGAATRKKLAVTQLRAEKATTTAVLSELPRARYAHLATHGFFADASFRSVLQLDPKQFEMSARGERVGAGALSPLVMTGLVFAGANDTKTPGRGIVTGESLVDLDLSGLELAVLSACESGLGDVAGGEGTFGLQRAFHLAGARNVVASLWKVPDKPTAALMALFYRNLWEKELVPIEALRQAQLELYRNPGKIAVLADAFRGKFDEVPGAADAGTKPTTDGKAHPRLWAAFSLSGPGR